MTTKTEKQKTLLTIPKAQLDRIKAVAKKTDDAATSRLALASST
jgi:hypothetical protein